MKEADIFVALIKTIASSHYGILQDDLLKKMGKTLQGKGGIEKLKALQDTDFIVSFKPHSYPYYMALYTPTRKQKKGAQIDLLFDRDDDTVTICEIKYSDKPFIITQRLCGNP